jgi:HK97 family phage major capsid protein
MTTPFQTVPAFQTPSAPFRAPGDAALENKAHDGRGPDPQVTAAFEDLRHAFEAFRETNDQRLAEIETRAAPDVLISEKLARIEASLDEARRRMDRVALEGRRPPLSRGEGAGASGHELAHKAAFDAYVRNGETAGLAALEGKALSAGSGPDGGYLAPHQV